jgi:hypothetical protein
MEDEFRACITAFFYKTYLHLHLHLNLRALCYAYSFIIGSESGLLRCLFAYI